MRLHPLHVVLSSQGFGQRHKDRKLISATEHDTKELPAGIVLSDGTLDVYEDVLKLFELRFKGGKPAIQCGRYLGYIPLNDEFGLEVSPRVPIGNLERLIGLASGYAPRVLHYTRQFSRGIEQPSSLFEIIADELLSVFDRIVRAGLLTYYEPRLRKGTSPVGRIRPFESALHTQRAGRPVAVSTAFHRSADFGPNRVIRVAIEQILKRYGNRPETTDRRRATRAAAALEKLKRIELPSPTELSPLSLAKYVEHLAPNHEHYAHALLLCELVNANVGVALRGLVGLTILPSILIDMETVFERYARRLLAERLHQIPSVEVRDGNIEGAGGAKVDLFDPIREGLKNPEATPDIVVMQAGSPKLIIDAKYKPSKHIPERADRNQVLAYGARFKCPKVMILYPARDPDDEPVKLVGSVGDFQLLTGQIDLGAPNIEKEERDFAAAIEAII